MAQEAVVIVGAGAAGLAAAGALKQHGIASLLLDRRHLGAALRPPAPAYDSRAVRTAWSCAAQGCVEVSVA